MASLGLTKFKIVPRSYSSGPSQGSKLGSLVSDAEVYDTGTNNLSVVYATDKGTVLDNPVIAIDGTITFYSSMPDVDVVVNLTNNGTIIRTAVTATNTHQFISDSSITTGTTVEAAGRKTANILNTVSFSLGLAGIEDVDYNFNEEDPSFIGSDPINPSVDETENEIQIINAIPAYAKVIDLSVITTEDSTFRVDLKVGHSRQGTQFHSYTRLDSIGEHMDFAASSLGTVDSFDSSASLFITAAPWGLWDDYIAGKWRLSVTYLDYGQLI